MNPTPPPRRPPPRPVEVARSERISPTFQRVTFTGPALEGFAITSPTGHVKLFLPPPGETEPALPTFGPNGLVWPEGAPPATVRTYTPRRFDASRLELDVEFFLHGSGAASTWAQQAVPGDRAAIGGPGRGYDPDPAAPWFLLAGDETAVPAIAMLLETIAPGIPVDVLVEVEGDDAEPALPDHPRATTTWVHRDGAPAGERLEAAVRAATLPMGHGRVWVATEAAAVRRVREHLLVERGLAAPRVTTRGYWRVGTPNHPDHDDGDTPL
jgi:NADPH-dependent ferric siderophore reductase